ncbi:MAG: sulfite exporter TauE/SafE family protein [Acidobacteriota bacterium]|nr:sulfite exporter TauE/SafE family protein [Acidobacteriota bacterium]
MSATELSILFGLGLVSSLHCVQMCGPVVVSFSLSSGRHTASQQVAAHLAYNVGRVITYGLLGAVAGLTGQVFDLAGRLAGVENIVAIVAGALMIVAGLLMLDLLPHRWLQRFDPLRYTTKLLRPLGSRLTSPTIGSKFVLGLMLGFLPCGLIYAALLKAMAAGTVLAGSMTMMAFGLGTVGALFALGVFSSAFSVKLTRLNASGWGSRLTAVSVALLGAVLVWRGVMPLMVTTEAANCHH